MKETGENSQKGNHRDGIDRQKGWGHRETWEAEREETEGRRSEKGERRKWGGGRYRGEREDGQMERR